MSRNRTNRRLCDWGEATKEKAVALMWGAHAFEEAKPQIADRLYEVATELWALAPKVKKLQAEFGELGDVALEVFEEKLETMEDQGVRLENVDTVALLKRLLEPMSPSARSALREFARISSYARKLEKEAEQLLEEAEAP
jgi:hypothetical protein